MTGVTGGAPQFTGGELPGWYDARRGRVAPGQRKWASGEPLAGLPEGGKSEFQAPRPLAPGVLTSRGTVQEARPCLGQVP